MEDYFVQPKNQAHFDLLDLCCQKIGSSISEKKIPEWTNADFVKLSGALRRKTKIHLSENTLKRIFGKLKTSDRYYPQKATRDALVQFIDFRDWEEFEKLNTVNVPQKLITKKQTNQNLTPKKSNQNKKTKWLVAMICFLAVLVAIYFYAKKNSFVNVANVKLECLNPNGYTPHSAFFKLKYKGDLPDSATAFKIDFADAKLSKPNFKENIISHYYEIPGRYFPKLVYGSKNIDTSVVYLKTTGWSAIAEIQHDTSRVYPVTTSQLLSSKKLFVSANQILKEGIDTNKTFFINFCNIKPSNISGDNFELKANIKTSQLRPGVRCSQADVVIFGEKDTHSIDIFKPECVNWNGYKFSELVKDGQRSDLRNIGYDLRNGGQFVLRIKQKNVSVFINGKRILNVSYKNSIGKVMGVKMVFSGIGSIENFSLIDLSNHQSF